MDGAALLEQARAGAPDLLLVLPDLTEIAVAGVPIRREECGEGEVLVGGRRWRLVRRSGCLAADDAVAAGHRAAVPARLDGVLGAPADRRPARDPLTEDVLHAPTATAERLGLPARLIAPLPLEPDRRRVRPGPATAAMLAAAASAYLDLVRATPPEQRIALVPPPGFPRSELDGRLRELLLETLCGAAWLPAARPGAELVPGRAEWLDLPEADPGLPALLADAGFDRLLAPVDAGSTPPGSSTLGPVFAELGVHRIAVPELVDRLLDVDRPPAWWHALYAALAPAADTVPGLIDDLRALPVPLADGRLIPAPRSVLLPPPPSRTSVERQTSPESAPTASAPDGVSGLVAGLGVTGLYVADPEAVHPLLGRLGAEVADPTTLVEHPALAAAVERSVDDAEAGLDPAPLAEAVLALVGELPGAPPAGFAGLALPDADGDPARADELMLPDAALRPLLAADPPIGVLDPAWATRFPRSSWTAVGVLDGFALVVQDDPAGPEHDLDDEERWWDERPEPPSRLLAVRDLDLVDDDAWPGALAVLAADRDTRAATLLAGGYTGWWLARHVRLRGQRPAHYRLPSARRLAALFDPVPDLAVDEAFLAAIGVRPDLAVPDARAAADLLARLADPRRQPDSALIVEAHAALAEAVTDGRVSADDLDPPQRVRALDGSVVGVDVAVVLDAPWLAALLPAAESVGGGDPVALAELLDLPLASEVVTATVPEPGEPVEWTGLAEVVLACQQLGVALPEGVLHRHDELWVSASRPVSGRFRVPAWCDERDRWHAEDPLRALLGVLRATR